MPVRSARNRMIHLPLANGLSQALLPYITFIPANAEHRYTEERERSEHRIAGAGQTALLQPL
jgi:hypothetical protein